MNLATLVALTAGIVAAPAAFAQPAPQPPTAPPSRQPPASPYTLLRYDEDYSTLDAPGRERDFFDPIKHIPLGRDNWHATLGGETRQRFESYHNYPFAPAGQDANGYFLQRYMAYADLHFGRNVRAFVELKSALVDGKDVPAVFDEDKADLSQLFGDLRLPFGDNGAITLRVGRQQLEYGLGRLIAVRDGPNNRQSFDGGKVIVEAGGWQVDALLFRQVEDDPGTFDDSGVDGQSLYGVYAARPGDGRVGVDVYALGYRREAAAFVQGVGTDERYSVGGRLYGRAGGWDYDAEAIYQFGRFGSGDVNAYYAGAIVGYTFEGLPLKPRLFLGADVGSGDRNACDADSQTFNPLFPAGNYYDEASLFTYANLYALRPGVELMPTKNVKLTLDAVLFWRQSTEDGAYDPGLGVQVATASVPGGAASDTQFIGVQPTAQVAWQVDQHLSVTASYSHLFAGDFVREATPPGGGEDVDFFAVWATYKF